MCYLAFWFVLLLAWPPAAGSFKCRTPSPSLIGYGGKCRSASDCVTFSCNNGSCGCPSKTEYNKCTATCFPRKSYGSFCTSSEPCETYLTCVSGICNCSSASYYHDSTKKTCNAKLSYNSICNINSSETQCQSNFACINSRCTCSSSQYYYSGSNLCRSNCIRILDAPNGIIVSPNYPGNYDDNVVCYWRIQGQQNNYITFSLYETDFEEESTCAFDYVAFYDGDSNSSPIIHKTCNKNDSTPRIFVSTRNTMYIVFKTDGSNRYRGFLGYYHIRAYNSTISQMIGTIANPGFPVKYPAPSYYSWTLDGGDEVIAVRFFIQMQGFPDCEDAVLRVYDGGDTNAKLISQYCQSNFSANLTSTTSLMHIVFKTNSSSLVYRGFNASFVLKGRIKDSTCSSASHCNPLLTCVDGICGCLSNRFYNASLGTCDKQLSYNSTCNINSSENQCQSNLPCVNSRCTCNSSQYYDSASNLFPNRTSHGGCCTNDTCDTYLTCLNGMCQCTSTHYHDDTVKSCSPRKSYGSFCTSSKPCETYLTCVSGICNCPSASYYHDSATKTCNARKSYGSFCTSSETCETYLTCVSRICNCSSASYYHDSTTKTCNAKLSYNSICNINSSETQCQSNLACINSRCTCSSSQYYDSGSILCRSRKSHGSSCTTDECDTYLTCLNGICQCTSTHYHDDTVKSCSPKLSYDSICNIHSSENQCQSNLACVNSSCTCSSSQYYDSGSNLCGSKMSYGNSCSSDTCVTYLTCVNGMCQCLHTHYHDDTGKSCAPKSNFGGICSNQMQCLGNVNCINKQCVCTSVQFYNPASTSCQSKLETKALCNISIDGMCRGPNLQCLPDVRVTPRCLCKEDMYEYLGGCLSLQEIKVSWPIAGRRLTDSIELRWTTNRNGATVTYQAIVTPLGSPQDVRRYDAMAYGVNVTGLQPGREYNITIVTITTRDKFYSSRSVDVEFVSETAPPVYGPINASTSFLSRPPYRLSFPQPSGYVYKYKVVLSDGEFTSTYHVNASELTLTDLKSGTLYLYSVTAYNKNGDYSEAVVGSFKTESQDDTDKLAVIVGASVAGVIVIILITLAVVVIRKRKKGAGKPSASSNVEMTTTPEVERVPLARQNPYKNVPKAIVPVPPKKPVILEDDHVYEEYGTSQNKPSTLGKTESSTDDCNSAAKCVTSLHSKGAFAGDEAKSSAAIKDDENAYQNLKLGVKSDK